MLQSGKGDSDSKKTATADKPKNKNIFKDPEVPGCSRQPAQRLNRLNNDKQIVNHRVLSCHRCLWMLVSFEIFGGHPRVWRLPTKQLSILEYSIDLFEKRLALPYAGDGERLGGGVHSFPLPRWVLSYRPWDGEHDLADKAMFEGSLEVKLPTIWTDEKQRGEESERREE